MRARLSALLVAVTLLGGCAVASGPTSRTPAPEQTRREPGPARTSIDPAQAERLQRLMIPLIRAMNNPRPLNQVRVGILDSSTINAASAGGAEFYVTRGLLQKADDRQLMGVLAHEIAHDDLNHVARAQAVGTGLNIGIIILDQIIPGSGAITPIAGELIARGYSRSEEYAADRHGVELLRRIGQPKQVMIDTLTWLVQTSGDGSGGFLSTHPAGTERVEALQKLP
jgi:predicted Zn-dependent protease